MRILLLDPDHTAARTLHAKLLTYKGIYWDLEHFESAESATTALVRDAFDVALIRLRGDESLEGHLSDFVEAASNLPTLACIDPQHSELEMQWIAAGFNDIVIDENLSADQIMRRLRLCVARFERQLSDLQAAKLRWQHVPVGPMGTEVADEDHDLQLQRLENFPFTSSKKTVAILRDHGTPRLLEGSENEIEIEVFRELKSYRQAVRQQPTKFDVAIVDQELLEREGSRLFEHQELRFPSPPLILLASERSDAAAVSQIAEGFDDVIAARGSTTSTLLRAIRLTLARWDHLRQQVREAVRSSSLAPDRRQQARSGRERRIGSRYLATRPLLAIPVLADGCPDRSNIRDAFTIDIATGGIGFQISNHQGIPGRNWILGVETEAKNQSGSEFHYCHVIVRNVSYPQGGVRLGAQFQLPATDLLNIENLTPKLNLASGRFEHRLSQRALNQWNELGVIRPKLLLRVNACPECKSVATQGRGCRECGSPDIQFKDLVHHFACAAVDDARNFERDGELCCPKCLTKPLVIGVDFKLIQSQYECLDCRYEGSQLADVGTCLKCQLRFPTNLAVEEEVYGYDVDRLDILALLDTAS